MGLQYCIVTRLMKDLITDDEADGATMQNVGVKSECFVGDDQHGLRIATTTRRHVLLCQTFTDHPYCRCNIILAENQMKGCALELNVSDWIWSSRACDTVLVQDC